MTDPGLPHIPRFDYGSSSLTLTYPVTRWIPGARTNGLVLKAADGTPGSVVNLRKYTLAMTLRFTEDEWTDLKDFIHFGQTGAEFEFVHGEVNPDIPPSFTCTLGAPRLAAGVRPQRDGGMPWLMTLPIVLEADEGWYIQYFGTSFIPIPPIIIPVADVVVTLADNAPDSTDLITTATAVLYDADGNVMDPTGHLIVWSSSDVTVATVDQNGLVTLEGPGTCDIIATCEGIVGFDTLTVTGVPALNATGGTITTGDGFVYHRFTAGGNFTIISGSAFVDVFLVAGGGGGGDGQDRTGGGGGAGGAKEVTNMPMTPGVYPVVVGAGGAGGVGGTSAATNGGNSSFNGQSVTGGGHGKGFTSGGAANGGSGGGVQHGPDTPGTGIAGQGHAGGASGDVSGPGGSAIFASSGGGGAGFAGANAVPNPGGGAWVASQTKTFARPGAPSAIARNDWRIRIVTVYTSGSTFPTIGELQLRATVGGANQTGGGTFSASSNYPGENPADAFDGSAATKWSAGGDAPQWLRVNKAAPIVVNEISIQARSDQGWGPLEFYIESSNDGGTTWDPEWEVIIGVVAGKGGDGVQNTLDSSGAYYAGGGSGSVADYRGGSVIPPATPGGLGGGGQGGASALAPGNGSAAVANTGGGGGGGARAFSSGGAGGSGVVIIRYPLI